MGAKGDALRVELAHLLPGEMLLATDARTAVADVVGGEEDGGGEAELLENGEGVGVQVTVAIVESQNYWVTCFELRVASY